MRIIVATCLWVVLMGATPGYSNAQAEKLEFFTSPKANAAQFATAVNHFIELGEAKAIDAIKAVRSKQTFNGKVDVQLRLACVCRVLWQNTDDPMPAPKLGMYGGGISIGAGESEKSKDWPLFPVAKAGMSYFIVVHGGRGGTGTSHRLSVSYLKQCQTLGCFLIENIPVPAKLAAEKDAKQLRQSARWKSQFPEQGDDGKTWTSIESQVPTDK